MAPETRSGAKRKIKEDVAPAQKRRRISHIAECSEPGEVSTNILPCRRAGGGGGTFTKRASVTPASLPTQPQNSPSHNIPPEPSTPGKLVPLRFPVPLDFFLHQDWNITPIGKELRADLGSEETADNCLRKVQQYLTHFETAKDISPSHHLNPTFKLPPPHDTTVQELSHIVGYNTDASSPFVQRGYLFALYGLAILGFYPCFFPSDIPHPDTFPPRSFDAGSADSGVALAAAYPRTDTETAVDSAPAVSSVALNSQSNVTLCPQLRDHLVAVFLVLHKSQVEDPMDVDALGERVVVVVEGVEASTKRVS
ncbi:hypothetical protein B0H11DRAFT_2232037 [Mycena galericulata]|nr:hypothetical protein B0H11DRAFT_2232037 [Mycena galericulata]